MPEAMPNQQPKDESPQVTAKSLVGDPDHITGFDFKKPASEGVTNSELDDLENDVD